MAKERKTINVSLQSKKYLDSVNKILNEWEDDSLNLSTQICETLLLMDRLKKSATFANVIAMYELIERMMKVYHIEDETLLNKIFSEVVQVDNLKLTQLLSQLNQEQKPQQSNTIREEHQQINTQHIEKQEVIVEKVDEKTEIKTDTKEKPQVPPNIQTNDELAVTGDVEVPLDFLLNG